MQGTATNMRSKVKMGLTQIQHLHDALKSSVSPSVDWPDRVQGNEVTQPYPVRGV